MPGARVAILDDDGRELPDGTPTICVQSPTVMQGYLGSPH